ncbi:non-ribosomal peptide synthetase [Roseivivax sp. CAU 1753]
MENHTETRPRLRQQERYWREQLSEATPTLDPCLDTARPAAPAYMRDDLEFRFSDKMTARIGTFCQDRDLNVLVLFLVAVKVGWVQRGADERLPIGVASVEREEPAPDPARCFVNSLPIMADIGENLTGAEAIDITRAAVRDAARHSDLPFADMVGLSAHDPMSSRAPIFQTMMLAFDLSDRWTEPGKALGQDNIADVSTACDAVFQLSKADQSLRLHCQYDTEVFSSDTLQRSLSQIARIVEAITADPMARFADMQLMGRNEKHLVVDGWNQTDAPTPHDKSFVALFQERVGLHPDAIAAQYGVQQLTYAELDRRADRAAQNLRAAGIGPEDLVALLSLRTLDLLVAILGVWKAGAAYVPLDPMHPPRRIAAVLQQSAAALVVTGPGQARLLEDALAGLGADARPIRMSSADLLQASTVTVNEPVWTDPNCLAYTIFTSGSTGTPKGAMVEQRGMINHLFAKIHDLQIGPEDTLAATASPCFDISVWQLVAALLVGGRVLVVTEEVAEDPVRLLELVARERITILQTVPSFLKAVLQHSTAASPSLGQLRWLISTGEALAPKLCRRWFDRYPDIPVLNAYGPTECSDDVTHQTLTAANVHGDTVSIGSPLANTRIYVTDARLAPRPIGGRGELMVGGIGVGRGYRGNPRQTAETFIPDPFSAHPGARLYRTGDCAKWSNDGSLEYIGRLDHQLKLRGFRVEPHDIETVLRQHPDVSDVVIKTIEAHDGDLALVAYLCSAQSLPAVEAHDFAKARLPVYMLPAAYVVMPEFPLNSNGKIDRAALPAPMPEDRPTGDTYDAPRGPTEIALAERWAVLFRIERVGRHDNFLDLGGHSLLATQLVSWVYDVMQVKLSIRDVFNAPYVDALAAHIDAIRIAHEVQRPGGAAEEEVVL